jgi:catechol 2,3-dioxygenase-like lactoylglutathione lyase family enzyme
MRLDHILLAVRDLEAATAHYRDRLGMNARVGGMHPGVGTRNSLVHFGTAYLELIGVDDAALPRGQALARYLEQGDAPYTFALAVADLEAASAALRAGGLAVDNPRDGSRKTPDGVLLRWRAADVRPGASSPSADSPQLPFLIEWSQDDAGKGWFRDRVALGAHDAGWGAVHALLIATPDAAGLAAEYERLLGWEKLPGHGLPALSMPGGDAVNPALGPTPNVVLIEPAANDASELRRFLGDAARARIDRHGAGVLGLAIHVRSVEDAVAHLARRGVHARIHAEGRWALVEPNDAHGLVIELVAS